MIKSPEPSICQYLLFEPLVAQVHIKINGMPKVKSTIPKMIVNVLRSICQICRLSALCVVTTLYPSQTFGYLTHMLWIGEPLSRFIKSIFYFINHQITVFMIAVTAISYPFSPNPLMLPTQCLPKYDTCLKSSRAKILLM